MRRPEIFALLRAVLIAHRSESTPVSARTPLRDLPAGVSPPTHKQIYLASPCDLLQAMDISSKPISSQVIHRTLLTLSALLFYPQEGCETSAAWSEELWQSANGLPSIGSGWVSGPLKLASTPQESLRSIPLIPTKVEIRQTPSVS